ncbi:MAG: hypothetical protein QF486_06560 [Candidatus Woesearchaeota archaeon]|jgi:hypothetical protein|nr:hypothetical protein [Candidatus Woesearchaeota archaeon]MDP7181934.1 hypothetical protein [Candidatus Woesearchaeota archaeon]MDP7199249.1 hypothetical protein [Candidatus Woesearchaeota archaeon]MDP7467862.1 hypothetical protein [Candidatus Woesearchaeota archaeon]MDP7647852.1 hypothetical protein [Candidatus Woesearchaeota archaeon]
MQKLFTFILIAVAIVAIFSLLTMWNWSQIKPVGATAHAVQAYGAKTEWWEPFPEREYDVQPEW